MTTTCKLWKEIEKVGKKQVIVTKEQNQLGLKANAIDSLYMILEIYQVIKY